jgi:hypothetical protein
MVIMIHAMTIVHDFDKKSNYPKAIHPGSTVCVSQLSLIPFTPIGPTGDDFAREHEMSLHRLSSNLSRDKLRSCSYNRLLLPFASVD